MSERMHLLNAPKPVFDGPPVVFYAGNESLPPAATPYRPVYEVIPPAYAASAATLVLPPDVQGLSVFLAVKTLINRGWRNVDIANALDVDGSYVGTIRSKVKKQQAQAQARVQGTPHAHHVFTTAPVAEAGFATPLTCATPAPAPAPIPMPVPAPLGPWQASREPVRSCHVLDWRDRMHAWKYEDHYQKPRPKHYKKRLTNSQIKDEWNTHMQGSSDINPPKRDRPAQSIAETPADPFASS